VFVHAAQQMAAVLLVQRVCHVHCAVLTAVLSGPHYHPTECFVGLRTLVCAANIAAAAPSAAAAVGC
jgi:hypothetical protein